LVIGFNGNSQAVEESSNAILQSGIGFENLSSWDRCNAKGSLPEFDHDKQFWMNRCWRGISVESVLRSRLPEIIEQLPSGTAFCGTHGAGDFVSS
jgi:hypothetical protein